MQTTITQKKYPADKIATHKVILSNILNKVFFKKLHKKITQLLAKKLTHDLSHSLRVAKNALIIAIKEDGDHEILVTAALLHDIVSLPKNHPNAHESSELAAKKAYAILKELNFPKNKFHIVLDAIRCHSFSAKLTPRTHEGKVFQDADRLDALGAIGIARTFATGAEFKSKLYSPYDPFLEQGRIADDKNYMLDHFFVKLFKIPAMMHTQTGKIFAQKRINFIKLFIRNLQNEIA